TKSPRRSAAVPSRLRGWRGRIRQRTKEKSRITPKPGGPAPHENSACPVGAEADTSTATAATASTGASQATLMTAQELGQPVMDRRAFTAIMGGSIVVAPLRQRGAAKRESV